MAEKRGGGITFVPLDLAGAEERFVTDLASAESPEQCYDRRWAIIFLQRVNARLGLLWREKGKAEFFSALSPFLFSELEGAETSRLAAKFSLTETNVKQILHRMKDDFREHFRQEVRDTVASDADVAVETAALRAAFLCAPKAF